MTQLQGASETALSETVPPGASTAAASTGSTIVRNASSMFASQIITWLLTLLLTVFLPRYLGPSAMGEFATALSLWMVLGYLVNLGMDVYIAKEVARNHTRLPVLLGTSYAIRTLMYLLLLTGLFVYLVAFPTSLETFVVIQVIGLATYLGMLAQATAAALQGLEKMQYSALGLIVHRFVNTVLVFAAIGLGLGLVAISGALAMAGLAWFLIQLYFLLRATGIRLAVSLVELRVMLRSSFPYFVASIVGVFYLQADVLLLNQMATSAEVGWYVVARQLYGTLLFVAVVFTTVMFPILTRTHVASPETMPGIMRKAFELMLVIAVPIGLGLTVISQQLVDLLFGNDYRPAGVILGLFGLVLICMYFNILFGQYYTSTDRQNHWTIVLMIGLVLVVMLNAIFVPMAETQFQNAAIGSALALLATEGFMCVAGVVLAPREMLRTSLLRNIPRVWLAGVLMYTVAYQFRDAFLAVPVIIGALVYVGCIIAFRVLAPDDVVLLRGLLESIVRKIDRRAPRVVDESRS